VGHRASLRLLWRVHAVPYNNKTYNQVVGVVWPGLPTTCAVLWLVMTALNDSVEVVSD
jgi:hypothetical protein